MVTQLGSELKAELRRRGLSTAGRKAALKARLEAAVAGGGGGGGSDSD